MTTKKLEKTSPNFLCEKCDFKCFKNSELERHNLTRKHKMLTNVDTNVDINTSTNLFSKKYKCVCGKMYSHRQSLSVHKKKCIIK
mgnify:CR=1 FL=1